MWKHVYVALRCGLRILHGDYRLRLWSYGHEARLLAYHKVGRNVDYAVDSDLGRLSLKSNLVIRAHHHILINIVSLRTHRILASIKDYVKR